MYRILYVNIINNKKIRKRHFYCLQLKFDAKGKDAQISEEIKMKKAMKKLRKQRKERIGSKTERKRPKKGYFIFFP